MERFHVKKLKYEESKGQYKVKIGSKFASLENLDDNVDISSACQTFRENIKISIKRVLLLQNEVA
jgi:hypothetical protein